MGEAKANARVREAVKAQFAGLVARTTDWLKTNEQATLSELKEKFDKGMAEGGMPASGARTVWILAMEAYHGKV